MIRIGNKAQAAEFFGVSLPTIEAWIRRGCPVVRRGMRGVAWQLDLLEVARWRFAPETKTDHSGTDPESMTPAERKLWYDGEQRRRDLQIRDRELLKADEVEQSISIAFAAVAQTLLSLPDNLERRAGLTPGQAESCERIIHEAMNGLTDRLSMLAPGLGD